MRLEFALTVVVAAVIAALALERIAELKASADGAVAQATASQSRAAAALAQARQPLAPSSEASAPCPVTPTPAPPAGAMPGMNAISCP